MGDDFTALYEYRGIDAAICRTITRLESGYEAPEVARVYQLGRDRGLAFARSREKVRWYPQRHGDPLPGRPELPDLDAQLALRAGFYLTFGRDTIGLYHLLRWHSFCTDTDWREVMVPAVNWFRQAFGATDAIVTWDCSWAACEFRAGRSFDRTLRTATDEGEVEVTAPEQLYRLDDEASDTAREPFAGGLARFRRWGRDRPLPPGWTRPQAIRWCGWWRPPRLPGRVT